LWSAYIRSSNSSGEAFLEAIQRKYDSLEKVSARIRDAVENKFKVDGTPDFFIFLDGKIAGVFEFHPISSENFIEVGFWLFPQFRRKGILLQSFPYMISFAARSFTKDKMVATTAVNNKSAQKLLERSGFTKAGEIEEPLRDGSFERQFMYELTLPKVAR
jgi:RimJ/RimL family protein N-acetyltransferase